MRLRSAPRLSASLYPRVVFADRSTRTPTRPTPCTPGTSLGDDLGDSCVRFPAGSMEQPRVTRPRSPAAIPCSH